MRHSLIQIPRGARDAAAHCTLTCTYLHVCCPSQKVQHITAHVPLQDTDDNCDSAIFNAPWPSPPCQWRCHLRHARLIPAQYLQCLCCLLHLSLQLHKVFSSAACFNQTINCFTFVFIFLHLPFMKQSLLSLLLTVVKKNRKLDLSSALTHLAHPAHPRAS